MLEKIMDVKSALTAGANQAALALALTLPDICSKIQYPSESKVGVRYANWCNTNIDFSEAHINGFEEAQLSGDMCYALRCSFLHSGNDDLFSQPAASKLKITSFELTKPDGIDGYGFRYTLRGTDAICTIDMGYLCDLICNAAEQFYNNFPDKSQFADHRCFVK